MTMYTESVYGKMQPDFGDQVHHYQFQSASTAIGNVITYKKTFLTAYEITWKGQVITRTKGLETLSFKVSKNEEGVSEIQVEDYIRCGERIFVVKNIKDTSNNNSDVQVDCYAAWYELGHVGRTNKLLKRPADNTWIYGRALLQSFLDWWTDSQMGRTLTTSQVPPSIATVVVRGFSGGPQTVLWWLRLLCKRFNLDMWFSYDFRNSNSLPYDKIIVHFRVTQITFPGSSTLSYLADGDPLVTGINMAGVSRNVDSRELATEMTLFGMVNEETGERYEMTKQGIYNYAFNYNWFSEAKKKTKYIHLVKTDERFSDPDAMRESATNYLAIYSSPFTSYTFDITYFKTLPRLYDWQLVVDDHMQISEYRKVTDITMVTDNMQATEINFSDPRKDAVDILNESEDDTL